MTVARASPVQPARPDRDTSSLTTAVVLSATLHKHSAMSLDGAGRLLCRTASACQ